MKTFNVTVIRTIKTVIAVEAKSKSEARRLVDEYGLIEASSDYKVLDETINAKFGIVT